jgi:hypothetical protein
MKKELWLLFLFSAVLAFLGIAALHSQNPQTSDVANTQPSFRANSSWTNGVAPGYWPTAGSGLTLNISAGTAICNGTKHTYAGSTLTMAASVTNYVYLDTTAACAPASNTTGFISGTTPLIPIAEVATGVSTITTITDDRTFFSYVPAPTGTAAFNPNSVTLFDDFVGGAYTASSSSNAAIMALGWTVQSSCVGGGCGLQPQPQSSVLANTIGILGISSDNGTAYIYLLLGINSTGGNQLNPQVNTFKEYWRVLNNNGGASGTSRLGLVDNRGVSNPANGVYFESGTGQSNTDWWCVQRATSVSNSVDTGINASSSGAYHTVEIDATGSSTVTWKIDGSAVCGSIGGTDLPNTGLDVAAQALGSGATAADMWLDYFRLDLTTTGR